MNGEIDTVNGVESRKSGVNGVESKKSGVNGVEPEKKLR